MTEAKRLFLIILTLLLSTVGSFEGRAADRNEAFAIYLSQLRTEPTIPLSTLTLSNKPFIIDADIVEYRWGTHEIILNEKAAAEYSHFLKTQNKRESGFVVVADGTRCYYGEFWLRILSVIPPFPVIYLDDLPASRSIKIGYDFAYIKKGSSEDPRDNRRIYEVFKRIQKLRTDTRYQ